MTLFLALFLACDDNYPPDLPLEASLTSCGGNDECVVVELGCCDHCNGGTAVAVNSESAEQVEQDFSETNCDAAACTLMGCFAYAATCVEETCALEEEIDTGK